jgi:hypothetical protein
MNTLATLVVVSLLVCATYAQTPCFARITATPRAGGSWTDQDGVFSQIYDITATNEGSCPLTRIVGYFSPVNGYISSSWNYDSSSGQLSNFGGSLAVGASFTSAGFILSNTTAAPVLALDRPGCPDECYAATSAPTSAPTSTSTPTSAPEENSTCSIEPVLTQEDASWVDSEGRNNTIYRLSITNTGSCPVTDYALSFGYYPGTLVSLWNLESTRGGYLVKGYGESLRPGLTYSGAGFIIADAPATVSLAPYGVACATGC